MERKIALFDMDDTLCGYRGKLTKDLIDNVGEENLKGFDLFEERKIPLVIQQKIRQIRQQKGWWRTLPPIDSGMQLWSYLGPLGFERHILTKAPYKEEDSNSWAEKFEWYKFFLSDAKNFTETLNKEYTFGNVLVDDWPIYISPWLKRWENSVAILPVHPYNLDFKHPRAIHYDGKNFKQIEQFLGEHKLI